MSQKQVLAKASKKLEMLIIKSKISESKKRSVYTRKAYWTVFDDIKIDQIESNYNTHTHRLSDYISMSCDGSIDIAINNIDREIKQKCVFSDIDDIYSAIQKLRKLSDFLRSCRTMLRHINKRSHQENKYSHSHLNNGFCLICHRQNDSKSRYCALHRKKHGDESNIRSKQRMIHKACSILQFIENPHATTKRELFYEKCYFLEGWAKHQPEHLKFNMELEMICIDYIDLYDTEAIWPLKSVEMFKKIVNLTKQHQHVMGIFHNYFTTGETTDDLTFRLKKEVLTSDVYENINIIAAITMISRMSIFALIEQLTINTPSNLSYKSTSPPDFRKKSSPTNIG